MRPRDMRPRENHDQPKEFQESVIHIARVARVVKGGRRFRFRALVAIGNGKEKVGVGISKGSDVQTAIIKAIEVAKKNIIEIPLENETIPHETLAKVGGSQVLLKRAAPGTGIIAGGTVRAVLELSGIHNVLSKTHGSTNKVNVAYATIAALKQLVPKTDWHTYKMAGVKSPSPAKTIPKSKKTVKTDAKVKA